MMEHIKIMIVNKYPILGYGIGRILEQNPIIKAVYYVTEDRQPHRIISLMNRYIPDIVLVDIDTQEDVKMIKQVRAVCCQKFKMVILTTQHNQKFLANIVELEAEGYISSNTKPEQLKHVIHSVVCDNQFYIQPDLMNQLINTPLSATDIDTNAQAKLYGKELEILELLSKGMSNEHIATILGIDEQELQKYIVNIMEKLNASSRQQAVELATEYSRQYYGVSIDNIRSLQQNEDM